MSNQIVISSGAKLRNLNGVITGTTGVLDSVPLGSANGVATLDSSGKVPVSQLPSSVVTYLGTWNAATNTPTLANGTGDAGDMYLCNVAGTVNFGAGPITFAVGDWVLYGSGTWQKSNGQNGTVTSVAVTESGDALTITGSPITTSGTINIGFAGTSAQYVAGNGSLITFPSLTGYVPYTGATQTLDMGAWDVNARGIKINGTGGLGHIDYKHQSGTPTGNASSTTMYANVDGDMAWKNDHNYITTLASHANTADRVYTFPNASGTVALTSDLSSYVPYTGATTSLNMGSNEIFSSFYTTQGDGVNGGSIYLRQRTQLATATTNYSAIGAFGGYTFYFSSNDGTTNRQFKLNSYYLTSLRNYFLPDADGTLALTSDIPSLSGYVPYTGATSDVNLGNYALTTSNTVFTPVLFSTYLYGGTTLVASPMTISTSDLVFQTGTAGSGSWSQKMVLTEAGNLGINTTTPSYLLDVNGTGRFTDYIYSSQTYGLALGSVANKRRIQYGSDVATSFTFLTDANGYAGIYAGAATFSSSVTANGKVTINKGDSGEALAIYGSGSTSYFFIKSNSSYTSLGSYTTGAGYINTIFEGGNVGIGTSSPSQKLDVYGVARLTNASSTGQYLDLYTSSAISYFNAYSNSAIYTAFQHIFQNQGTEAMRVASDGNVGIGNSSPGAGLDVQKGTDSSNISFRVRKVDTSVTFYVRGDGYIFAPSTYYFTTGGGANMHIASDGSLNRSVSSIKYKKNVKSYTKGLAEVMKMKPVTYNSINENETHTYAGLIAEEIHDLGLTEFVQYAEDGTPDALAYQNMVSLLVKAIQEQQAQIEELKAKIK